MHATLNTQTHTYITEPLYLCVFKLKIRAGENCIIMMKAFVKGYDHSGLKVALFMVVFMSYFYLILIVKAVIWEVLRILWAQLLLGKMRYEWFIFCWSFCHHHLQLFCLFACESHSESWWMCFMRDDKSPTICFDYLHLDSWWAGAIIWNWIWQWLAYVNIRCMKWKLIQTIFIGKNRGALLLHHSSVFIASVHKNV